MGNYQMSGLLKATVWFLLQTCSVPSQCDHQQVGGQFSATWPHSVSL